MVESIISEGVKELGKKEIAEKTIEKTSQNSLDKAEQSLRPRTENPLSKYERATVEFVEEKLSKGALISRVEGAAYSACKFFELSMPELTQGNVIGVYLDANIFTNRDKFCFNLDQFKKIKCVSYEDMSKIWSHECGHRVLKNERLSDWAKELGADFLMGVRSETLGLPSGNLEKALASQPASPTHPSGTLRIKAIETGRQYARDCISAGEPVTIEGSINAFRFSEFSKIDMQDFPRAESKVAALVNDKDFYYENASYYFKEGKMAEKNGDLAKAKDMQQKAEEYETKAKELDNNHYENIDVHEKLSKLSDICVDESNSIHERAKALNEIRKTLDTFKIIYYKDKEFFAMPEKVQALLETLWKNIYHLPKSNGEWREEGKTWFWKPDDSFVPPNKQYSNMWGKNWAQIKLENNIEEIPYKNDIVDFSKMARAKVEIDFPSDYRYDGQNARGPLHEMAFEKLAEQWGWEKKDVMAYKDRENLVWHEDVDCKTLYLVPREVHDNVTHFGGISMARIIKGQA